MTLEFIANHPDTRRQINATEYRFDFQLNRSATNVRFRSATDVRPENNADRNVRWYSVLDERPGTMLPAAFLNRSSMGEKSKDVTICNV